MKKAAVILLVLLVACSAGTTGKKGSQSPAGAVSVEVVSQNIAQEPETASKSAAEVLEDLKDAPTKVVSASPKNGTFYPPIKVSGTGKDALKEKTRALMSAGAEVPGTVDADKDFGPKYFSADGDPKNLPGDYGKSEAPE